jgi:hypothetical protein
MNEHVEDLNYRLKRCLLYPVVINKIIIQKTLDKIDIFYVQIL